MQSLTTAFGSAAEILEQSPRTLGGYILQLINADGSRRDHPKNIREHVMDVYAGPKAKQVAAHVLAAVDFLKREHYIYNDYQDAVDGEWFALTDKGLAIRNASQIEEPSNRLDSENAIVFVSCGQYTEAERAVGRRIARLVEEHTGCGGYFAENQQSLAGLSNNILGALNKASGMVVVMHRRGLVESPSGERFYRGSVWVEQEIAMAAFLQSLDRKILVAAYIEDGIRREGLRELLHLNPVSFNDDQEILRDFEEKLRSGAFSPPPVVELLTRATGTQIDKRVSAIEAGRYPRLLPGAASRIADRLQGETAQTATIAGEGGDDIREIGSVLLDALRSANWHVRETSLGATLWDSG
ncbi:MAG: hypothetical protein ABI408_04760, partial [Gemmatimonadaceae bacterium]